MAVRLRAEFVTSAASPEQFPSGELPEVAFLGRSNVGKSTLLNRVTGQGLAFTSSTPGRTQTLNFYRVEDQVMLVDLPGYGYAKAPREAAARWRQAIEPYLLSRKNLVLCVLLLDARRGWMESDLQLKQWLDFHSCPFLVVATKVDKLNQREKNASQRAIRRHYPDGEIIWFSGLDGQGVKEICQAIWKTTSR
jgi:GTP-binding protein